MALEIKIVEYFNIFAWDHAEGVKLLSMFAEAGINMLAFKAADTEPLGKQFTIFPDNSSLLAKKAKEAEYVFDGPHSALLIKGNNDEPGACADIFNKLSSANIDVEESSGIADINGSFGIVLYLKKEDCEKAVSALR